MPRQRQPLVGYNHNIKHHGHVFHVQTEDAGMDRGYVVTHLFAQGGWVIASAKTRYDELLEGPDTEVHLRLLMRNQHKSMALALRDGEFDAIIGEGPPSGASKRPASDMTRETHTMGKGKLTPSTPPPPREEMRHFNDVTVLLEEMAPEVKAVVIDLEAGAALALGAEAPPEGCVELVRNLLQPLGSSFDEDARLACVGADVAFAVIRRGNLLLFLHTSLATQAGVQRFQAVTHRVGELVAGRSRA